MMTQASDLYEKLALKYDLSVETVKEAVLFFWRSGVKTAIENFENQELFISKLGSFKIKDYKLKYVVRDIRNYLDGAPDDYKIEYLERLYNGMLKMQDQIAIIKEEKTKFNESNRKDSRNIQESETDLGGAQE